MKWALNADTLQLCRGLDKRDDAITEWTHRKVLSIASAVFDPLGLAAPFTILVRLLMKEIWRIQGSDWDSALPSDIQAKFLDWFNDLSLLEDMEISRCYSDQDVTKRELHVFADSSQEAFCVVAYFRVTNSIGNTKLCFMMGKSRVAPMKFISIPKLELQAAVSCLQLV